MFIVAVAFALVFLFRDLQVLSMARVPAIVKFAGYSLITAAGVVVFGWLSGGQPALIERRFGLGAIVAQFLELSAALFLQNYRLGRYGWFGCVLPAPAFLLVVYFLGWELQTVFPGSGAFTAVALVTGLWICIVIVLTSVLYAFNNPWEDRRFATDFAMMTACTAVVFFPIWLS